MKSKLLFLSLFLLITMPKSAEAVTARDYRTKMPQHKRSAYLIGIIDMHSYYTILAGDRARARCITNTAKDDAVVKRIFKAFDRWPNKPVAGLVVLITNKACPK